MLFESAKEAGLENRFLKISSFLSGTAEATRTMGTVIAGVFVHGLLDVTYVIQIAFSLLVIFFIFMMKEPSVKEERDQPASLKNIIKTVIKVFRRTPRLLYWLMMSQLICVFMCMFYFYYPE